MGNGIIQLDLPEFDDLFISNPLTMENLHFVTAAGRNRGEWDKLIITNS